MVLEFFVRGQQQRHSQEVGQQLHHAHLRVRRAQVRGVEVGADAVARGQGVDKLEKQALDSKKQQRAVAISREKPGNVVSQSVKMSFHDDAPRKNSVFTAIIQKLPGEHK